MPVRNKDFGWKKVFLQIQYFFETKNSNVLKNKKKYFEILHKKKQILTSKTFFSPQKIFSMSAGGKKTELNKECFNLITALLPSASLSEFICDLPVIFRILYYYSL